MKRNIETTVYLDLDGVLADFNGTTDRILKDLHGPDFDWDTEVRKPMWGLVGDIKDLYSRLDVLPDAHELVEYVGRYGNVEILTAIPRRGYFPDAVDHKREWVAKHFPEIKHINFGPYAKDKQYHYRRGDILIDDTSPNVNQWIARGGYAVLHTTTADTIEQMESKRRAGLLRWLESLK